jgi:hypothetical protein
VLIQQAGERFLVVLVLVLERSLKNPRTRTTARKIAQT